VKRLIVNADDFGLCGGANLGILQAHRTGIVTSATVMVNMPGAAEAYELARHTPTLGVGVHITLTGGRPVAEGVDSLCGPDGAFLKLPQLMERARPGQVECEVRAQVDAFLASGLKPTHLDSHHHVHMHLPAAGAAVDAVAAELGVPVRRAGPGFIGVFYGKAAITVERLLQILAGLPEGTSELMCHPAFLDPLLLSSSSYARERVVELATLTDPLVLEAVRSHCVTLTNYREVQP